MNIAIPTVRFPAWLPLIALIIFAFALRARPLLVPTSFWSDEALTSSFAKELALSKNPIQTMHELSRHTYQPLQIITIAASFRVLGVSEGSARFPSVLWSTMAVIFAYLFLKKISSARAAFVGTLFLSSSQLILGQTTQAKPYAALLALLFVLLWLFTQLGKSRHPVRIIAIMAGVVVLSTGYHIIGLLYILFPLIGVLMQPRESMVRIKKHPGWIALFSVVTMVVVILVGVPDVVWRMITTPGVGLWQVNNISSFRLLFFVHYSWLTIPAALSLWSLRQKQSRLLFAVALWAGILIYAWTFVQYSRNVRYLVPLIGLLFGLSGLFWEKTLFWLDKKYVSAILFGTVTALVLGTNKFVIKPQAYYSPNADFHADVQNADYRGLYQWIHQTYPESKDLVIVNNVFDAEQWYLGRYSNVYFSKTAEVTGSYIHPFANVPVYSTVEEFQTFQAQHPAGIFIVEDWESYLPESVKSYVKENLTELHRISCLPQSPSDCWPLAVYAWGDSVNPPQAEDRI